MAGLNETNLIKFLEMNIDDIFMHATEIKKFLEILYMYTLPEFSIYYPSYVPNVFIKKEYAIPEIMESGNGRKVKVYRRYRIPKPDSIEYISIASWSGYGSEITGTSGNANGFFGETLGAQLINQLYLPKNNFIIKFEPPNFAIVSPHGYHPIQFVLKLKRVAYLHEILLPYHKWVRELFLADVKNYLYNKYNRLAQGGVYNGLEITLDMGKYEDGKEMKNTIIEQMEEDWYKDPNIYEELMSGM